MKDTPLVHDGPDQHAPDTAKPPLRQGIGLLWSYTRPRLRTVLAGVLLGLFATAVTMATPMATKWVIDALSAGSGLGTPVAILVGLLIIGMIAGFAQSMLLGRLAEGIVLDARTTLIERCFRSKLEQIQQFRVGELVTRVTSDTVLLREATTSSIVQLVNGTVSLVATIVLMAVLDWKLLITTLVALAVIGVGIAILLPRIGQAEKQAQDSLGELGASLGGGIRALRTVKSSRAEAREIAWVGEKAADTARYAIRSVRYGSLVGMLAGGGTQLAVIVILGLGAARVASGDLTVSTLVAFLLYAFNIVEPIVSLAGAFSSVQSGLAAAARIHETNHLELEDTHSRPTATVRPHPHPGVPLIALRDVTAGYLDASTPALNRVNLEIPRAGHVALVGPSGAGKTTVFSLVLRFLDPSSGRLELDGISYEQLSIDEVRSRIAYVEQETPVIPASVRHNVCFRVPDATDAEVWDALEAVRLADRIRSLPAGLDTLVAETNLSGGERQRLAVARALVRRPGLLLLDEATAQLDATTEAAIHQVIAEAGRTGTVVTIAHRLSTIVDADQIIVLDKGTVRDTGTHQELIARDDLYREFVSALRISTEIPEDA